MTWTGDDLRSLLPRRDPHDPTYRGDPAKTGIAARWRWECFCGLHSVRQDMTIAEATKNHDDHRTIEELRRNGGAL